MAGHGQNVFLRDPTRGVSTFDGAGLGGEDDAIRPGHEGLANEPGAQKSREKRGCAHPMHDVRHAWYLLRST